LTVLIEAFSVIIRTEAIREKYFGGVKSFMDDVPNSTFCTDGSIIRIGFMSFDDAFFYIAMLKTKGLHNPYKDEENTDIAYAMQGDGVVSKCSWLITEKLIIAGKNHEITACSLTGDTQQGLSVPLNWSYEQYASLSLINDKDFESAIQDNDSSIFKVGIKNEAEPRYVSLTNLKTNKDEPLH
jgi:hypothetical protein